MQRLREAVAVESEIAGKPSLLILEGVDLAAMSRPEAVDLKELASELGAEVWIEAASSEEHVGMLPPAVAALDDLISVVLALEPEAQVVRLRALKDHENPDVADLHVSRDPHTLLLVRS